MKLYETTIKMLYERKFTIKKKTYLYYLNATEYYIRPQLLLERRGNYERKN